MDNETKNPPNQTITRGDILHDHAERCEWIVYSITDTEIVLLRDRSGCASRWAMHPVDLADEISSGGLTRVEVAS